MEYLKFSIDNHYLNLSSPSHIDSTLLQWFPNTKGIIMSVGTSFQINLGFRNSLVVVSRLLWTWIRGLCIVRVDMMKSGDLCRFWRVSVESGGMASREVVRYINVVYEYYYLTGNGALVVPDLFGSLLTPGTCASSGHEMCHLMHLVLERFRQGQDVQMKWHFIAIALIWKRQKTHLDKNTKYVRFLLNERKIWFSFSFDIYNMNRLKCNQNYYAIIPKNLQDCGIYYDIYSYDIST